MGIIIKTIEIIIKTMEIISKTIETISKMVAIPLMVAILLTAALLQPVEMIIKTMRMIIKTEILVQATILKRILASIWVTFKKISNQNAQKAKKVKAEAPGIERNINLSNKKDSR